MEVSYEVYQSRYQYVGRQLEHEIFLSYRLIIERVE